MNTRFINVRFLIRYFVFTLALTAAFTTAATSTTFAEIKEIKKMAEIPKR